MTKPVFSLGGGGFLEFLANHFRRYCRENQGRIHGISHSLLGQIKCITDQWTDGRWMDGQTDTPSYRVALSRLKSGCHPSKNGHWTQKHFRRRMGPLETYFGVIRPFFHSKGPLILFRGYDKLTKVTFRRDESGCHPSKRGY